MSHYPIPTALVPPARLVEHARANLERAHPGDRSVVSRDGADLAAELQRHVDGEVRFDDGARALYAHDASNYRQVPIGVVIPRSTEDVVATFSICRAFGAPIVSRAGGTSLCGQAVNVAVLIDWSKYRNAILELDAARRLARVEPGVICDDVARMAKPFDLTYGPQPATHNRCCFGGMLSNNSCGIHAQMAGKAVDNTESMEVLLYDGTRMSLGWMHEDEWDARIARGGRVGDVHRRLRDLRERYRALIVERYPRVPRRVSGYNLDSLLPGPDGRLNLARALVGTEGTCVAMLEMTVRLVHSPPFRAVAVLGYPDVYRAADHLTDVLPTNPLGLEALDARLYEHVRRKHDPNERYLGLLPAGFGWLFAEYGGATEEEAKEKAEGLAARLRSRPDAPSIKVVTDPAQQAHVWLVRESGLGATAFVPGQPDTWEGWEDSAVAPEDLGGYLRDLRALWDRYRYDSVMYGHFGMGCLHARVNFDLSHAQGIAKWRRYMEEATDLVAIKYKGSISGEHGDGQSKAEFLHKMFGPELVRAFGEFKAIWDPDEKMNPGKIVQPYRIDENLRLGGDYRPWEPATHFEYPEDGGSFAHATLRCVGVGRCRRTHGEGDQDTMCPSFMVTREEEHSTRGRAHLLFEMLQRGPLKGGWRDEHVKQSLDLCLSCKGCKSDCPVNVDLATYKAEFLSHYWEGRLRPRTAYAFGYIDKWARLASVAPGVPNLFTQLPVLSRLGKLAAGVDPRRKIPAFAAQTFRAWFAARLGQAEGKEAVLLWPDTFNNYFTPEVLQAATQVIEDAGFRVEIPPTHLCCGRPLYDYGMLDQARSYLEQVLHVLRESIRAGVPIVVLEPSCCAVFRDELTGLMSDRGDARRLASQVVTLAEFLSSGRVRATGWTPARLPRKAIVQGHCHHKAIMKLDPDRRLLEAIGLDAEVLESGCCGMAGSFGYERDKFDVSMAAAKRVLLPRVRAEAKSSIIVADGFSCRTQIEAGSDRQAVHLAQVLELARSPGPGHVYPEWKLTAHRRATQRRSMVRAGAALFGLGAAVLWLFKRRRSARRLLTSLVVGIGFTAGCVGSTGAGDPPLGSSGAADPPPLAQGATEPVASASLAPGSAYTAGVVSPVPPDLVNAEIYAANVYRAVDAGQWDRATHQLRYLEQAVRAVRRDTGGESSDVGRLARTYDRLHDALAAGASLDALRASNEITLIATNLIDAFGPLVPADVDRMAYHARALRIAAAAHDRAAIERDARELGRTWSSARPFVQAHVGDALTRRVDDTVHALEHESDTRLTEQISKSALDDLDAIRRAITDRAEHER